MNLILIVTDTLRPDFLGCYGNPWVKTPRIDAFARQSVQFNCVHGEGLPTIQARRVFMTGREILPFEDAAPRKGVSPGMPGWRALGDEDVTLADFLSACGYYCGMATDLWHLFKPTMNFHRGFHIWEFIRGQEGDPWRTSPRTRFDLRKHIPAHLYNDQAYERNFQQYLRNTDWFRGEEDYFCARTMRTAARWLENCRDRAPFFLYVDTFDPHEPFDPPKQYARMYGDNYPCERPIYGYGVNEKDVRDEDVPWIRGLYAGEVSLVDTWIGHLIETVDRLGLAQDTVVAVTTDHGTEFREHGRMMKSPGQLYRNVTRIPLILRAPGAEPYAGKQVEALISAVDIAPSLLRLIGQTPPPPMSGLDLWQTATGQRPEIRTHLISGYGRCGAVRDHEWLFQTVAQPHAKHAPAPAVAQPALFDLKNDPGETRNVIEEHPDVAQRMRALARRVWPEAL